MTSVAISLTATNTTQPEHGFFDFSNPVSIISRPALFPTAGDYGVANEVLEGLDERLVLPNDIDKAKEIGQGSAIYIIEQLNLVY